MVVVNYSDISPFIQPRPVGLVLLEHRTLAGAAGGLAQQARQMRHGSRGKRIIGRIRLGQPDTIKKQDLDKGVH